MALIKVIGNEENKFKNRVSKSWDYWDQAENSLKTRNGFNKSYWKSKNKFKITLTQADTTEIMLRTVSKHKMALIKVIGNANTS